MIDEEKPLNFEDDDDVAAEHAAQGNKTWI